MPTPQKAVLIDELFDQLSRANLAILTDYRGLKVSDLQTLRASLRAQDADFRIAKNTFTRIAVFAYGEIAAPAKTITDFVRSSRILTVKGGILESRFISAADIDDVASLPSRDVLLGRLVGMLASPMARTVGVLGGPSRSLAYVLKSRVDQLGGVSEAEAAD